MPDVGRRLAAGGRRRTSDEFNGADVGRAVGVESQPARRQLEPAGTPRIPAPDARRTPPTSAGRAQHAHAGPAGSGDADHRAPGAGRHARRPARRTRGAAGAAELDRRGPDRGCAAHHLVFGRRAARGTGARAADCAAAAHDDRRRSRLATSTASTRARLSCRSAMPAKLRFSWWKGARPGAVLVHHGRAATPATPTSTGCAWRPRRLQRLWHNLFHAEGERHDYQVHARRVSYAQPASGSGKFMRQLLLLAVSLVAGAHLRACIVVMSLVRARRGDERHSVEPAAAHRLCRRPCRGRVPGAHRGRRARAGARTHPIWRFFGADEPNYATMKDGRAAAAASSARSSKDDVYFRAAQPADLGRRHAGVQVGQHQCLHRGRRRHAALRLAHRRRHLRHLPGAAACGRTSSSASCRRR